MVCEFITVGADTLLVKVCWAGLCIMPCPTVTDPSARESSPVRPLRSLFLSHFPTYSMFSAFSCQPLPRCCVFGLLQVWSSPRASAVSHKVTTVPALLLSLWVCPSTWAMSDFALNKHVNKQVIWFYMYECLVCMFVCASCIEYPQRAEEAVGSSGNKV